MAGQRTFVGYPAVPSQIGQTIDTAIQELSHYASGVEVESWRHLDIAGRFIVDGVLQKIDAADIFVADITRLNFNVTFEAGYAIGRGKRILPIINSAVAPDHKEINQLGIFDTIGYQKYENSAQLRKLLNQVREVTPLTVPGGELNRSAPIYVLDTLYKTDTSLRITSKIKKARLGFRSFDPKEQSRLSAVDAYRNVASSIAVVVNLLSSNATDYLLNNFRGAFLAGLAFGMGKECLTLQEGEEPVPIDYRDFVSVYRQPADIDGCINELAPKVAEGLQAASGITTVRELGLLESLDLGSPAAENEMSDLGQYYVETDEYNRTLSGNIRLAVGRKGSGKTALLFQIRDRVRRDTANVVLDLRPDGHQLKRFRHMVLDLLADAAREHVAKAFWEYVLLLEIAYKLLEKDRQRHTTDHTLFDSYRKLDSVYRAQYRKGEVDFSERMLELVERINQEFSEKYGDKIKYLSAAEVTELIYKHEVPVMQQALIEYLQQKGDVWILFDNIDKGWPTHGVDATDILVLRSLLDASRHLQQFFARHEIPVRTVVFVRNDVYELLVNETPDRGKESRVSLDWTDGDLLKEFLRRRIVHNDAFDKSLKFDDVWPRICVSHINGEDTADYLISRSLMRPRNLLTLVNYCKSNAVNLGHPHITKDDITKAAKSYSADIVNEIGLEVRDVFPQAIDLLYYFINSQPWLNLKELRATLSRSPVPAEALPRVIELLVWFSFLGVVREKASDVEEVYIYDVFYDMKKLKQLANGMTDENVIFGVHRAFWPFLDIVENKTVKS